MPEGLGRLANVILGEPLASDLRLWVRHIDRNAYYDRLTQEIIRRVVPPDGLCIDVGCHSGDILRMLMAAAPRGRFVGFEPLPGLVSRLEQEFAGPMVEINRAALSNSTGRATFKHVVSNPAYSGFRQRTYERTDEEIHTIDVSTIRLDDFVTERGMTRLDFMKVDVEGAERLVFDGGRASIRRFKPHIAFEFGMGAADHYGTNADDIYEVLCRDCGLGVSTLSRFLRSRTPLARLDFARRFSERLDYFFIAFPV